MGGHSTRTRSRAGGAGRAVWKSGTTLRDSYGGPTGAKVGMNTFGSSAPLKDLLAKFGFTPEKVLAAAKEQIARSKRTSS